MGNALLRDNLTSEVALEEAEIKITHPNIPMYTNCTDDNLHLGMPVGSGEDQDQGDKTNAHDSIPTSSWRQLALTELERFGLGISNVDAWEDHNGDNADADEVEEALQADDESTRNVQDQGHSTVQCEDWKGYFRTIKYDDGEANATECDAYETKTGL